ncbi:MAG TPA: hypothetical protein VGL94_18200 [Ktedonobacteraceae bacterium]|jgi:hypothetical protein
MESMVKILGAFLDTLVLNVYPTDHVFEVEERRVDQLLQEELKLLKEQAQEVEEDFPTRFAFNGASLLMRAKGGDGFNWIMHNHWLSVAVNRSSKAQILAQVRLSSAYLWRKRDLGQILVDVHQFLMSIFGDYITLHVSSCDLAVDVMGLDLSSVQQVKEHFVSRAQLTGLIPSSVVDDGMIDGPDSIKQRWGRITGLPFGARGGALSALLYDKTHEIKYKSPDKAWFHDLWRQVKDENGEAIWDGQSPVWRIEVRYKRQALNEMQQEGVFHGIDNAYDLEERLPGLWSYAVGHVDGGEDGLPDGWLRYIIPTEDTNRSRWPVHPDWRVVQSAFAPVILPESDYEREEREKEELLQLVDEELEARPWKDTSRMVKCHTPSASAPVALPLLALPLDLEPFMRKRRYQVNLRRMVAQIVGCTITTEAWRPAGRLEGAQPDLSDTFHFLFEEVESYLEEKKRNFNEQVQKKRVLYSIEKEKAIA